MNATVVNPSPAVEAPRHVLDLQAAAPDRTRSGACISCASIVQPD